MTRKSSLFLVISFRASVLFNNAFGVSSPSSVPYRVPHRPPMLQDNSL